MVINLLSNFKAKILLVFSLFTPSEANKKPRYSKEERQAILAKKKEIRLKRKNRKKAILLNIAQLPHLTKDRNKDLSLMKYPYFIFIYLPENLEELNYYY